MGNSSARLNSMPNSKQSVNALPSGSEEDGADIDWESKLPKNYKEILARAVSPVTYNSKKELYYKFCNSLLIEGGTQRIWLDKSTGKLAYMLSARALDVTWGGDIRYWLWVSRDDSRFEQVAELKEVWWFEVWQRIDCTLLSPNTEYSVAFVLNIDKTKGKSYPSPFIFSLKTIDGKLCESARFLNDLPKPVDTTGRKMTPVVNSESRWKEFVVGNFDSKEDDTSGETREIEVSMKNLDCSFSKSSIIIDGVKIKPITRGTNLS